MFGGEDDDDDDTGGVTATRYPCMPSLVALQQMRNRLHLAYTGKKLMKWTALATGRELRKLAKEMQESYMNFREDMRQGFILLARSRYSNPYFNNLVLEHVGNEANIKVTVTTKSFTGVKTRQMHILDNFGDNNAHLGLGRGGETIRAAKECWREILKNIILMCQQRLAFTTLETAHKNSQKRKQLIARVVVPKLKATVGYILSELEEKEREDTFRLKRFKELKNKRSAKKEIKLIKEPTICPTCFCEFESNDGKHECPVCHPAPNTPTICPKCYCEFESNDGNHECPVCHPAPNTPTICPKCYCEFESNDGKHECPVCHPPPKTPKICSTCFCEFESNDGKHECPVCHPRPPSNANDDVKVFDHLMKIESAEDPCSVDSPFRSPSELEIVPTSPPCDLLVKTTSSNTIDTISSNTVPKSPACEICKKLVKKTPSNIIKKASSNTVPKSPPCEICKKLVKKTPSDIVQKVSSNTVPKSPSCEICKKLVKKTPSDIVKKASSNTFHKSPPCEICKKLVKKTPSNIVKKASSNTVSKSPPCEICKKLVKKASSTNLKVESPLQRKTLSKASTKSESKPCEPQPSKTSIPGTELGTFENQLCKVLVKKASSTNLKVGSPLPSKIVSKASTKTEFEPCEPQPSKTSIPGPELGTFENQFKEIIKVTRHQNFDGTICEVKQVITIRTEKRSPCKPAFDKRQSEKSRGSYECCSCQSVGPRVTKSEQNKRSDQMAEPTACSCPSSKRTIVNRHRIPCSGSFSEFSIKTSPSCNSCYADTVNSSTMTERNRTAGSSASSLPNRARHKNATKNKKPFKNLLKNKPSFASSKSKTIATNAATRDVASSTINLEKKSSNRRKTSFHIGTCTSCPSFSKQPRLEKIPPSSKSCSHNRQDDLETQSKLELKPKLIEILKNIFRTTPLDKEINKIPGSIESTTTQEGSTKSNECQTDAESDEEIEITQCDSCGSITIRSCKCTGMDTGFKSQDKEKQNFNESGMFQTAKSFNSIYRPKRKRPSSCPACPRVNSASCGKFKDASTNTKKSARYDVRGVASTPIRLQTKTKSTTEQKSCLCRSDNTMMKNKEKVRPIRPPFILPDF